MEMNQERAPLPQSFQPTGGNRDKTDTCCGGKKPLIKTTPVVATNQYFEAFVLSFWVPQAHTRQTLRIRAFRKEVECRTPDIKG